MVKSVGSGLCCVPEDQPVLKDDADEEFKEEYDRVLVTQRPIHCLLNLRTARCHQQRL